MRESVSYSKLRSGAWGVRVATKGRHPNPGDTVVVRKANGESNRVILGGIVDSDRGAFPGPAVIYAIAGRNRNQRVSKPSDYSSPHPYVRAEAARVANSIDAEKGELIRKGKRQAETVAALERRLAIHLAAADEGYDGELTEAEIDYQTKCLHTALGNERENLNILRKLYSKKYLGGTA